MTTYSPADFAASYSLRGYGKRKDALKWCEDNGVTEAREEDFERCWRDLETHVIQRHSHPYVAMHRDGQNPAAMGNVPNSYGRSFAAQMAIEQRLTDSLDLRIRRMKEDAEHEQIPLPQGDP